ncbi:MAG: hypothetical protein WBG34_09625 [Flavobacteriales bacterium]
MLLSNRNRTIGCIAIISSLFWWGCKKDVFDSRTKYYGNYSFSVHSSWAYGVPGNFTTGDTSYTEVGEVKAGDLDDAVEISTSSIDIAAILREDGSLKGSGNPGSGEFPTTGSLVYTVSYYSPGGSSTVHINGSKQ